MEALVAMAVVAGVAVLGWLTAVKLVTGADIGGRPLFLLGIMGVIVALQVLLFGLLAELINSRTPAVAPAALIRETVRGGE